MKIIAYYRVSTKKQGRSGLGLTAQQEAVAAYASANNGKILREYQEVESGKRSDREQLAIAVNDARLSKGVLVVAKLDRLARDVLFTATLMNSGIEFVACDNPHANRLTIHVLAAVAECEAKAASDRTRDALAAARKRGVKLGSARPGHWTGREQARSKGLRKAVRAASELRAAKAAQAYGFLLPTIQAWREAGDSLATVAGRLNVAGHRTTSGGPFSATAVGRVLARAAG